jgi:hypothetical protein
MNFLEDVHEHTAVTCTQKKLNFKFECEFGIPHSHSHLKTPKIPIPHSHLHLKNSENTDSTLKLTLENSENTDSTLTLTLENSENTDSTLTLTLEKLRKYRFHTQTNT